MKKTYALIFIFAFNFFNSYCFQNETNVKVYNNEEKTVKVIGEVKNKIYTLVLRNNTEYFLSVYDSETMNLISKSPIVIAKEANKDIQLEDVVLVDDKVYVVETVFSHLTKTNTLVGDRSPVSASRRSWRNPANCKPASTAMMRMNLPVLPPTTCSGFMDQDAPILPI